MVPPLSVGYDLKSPMRILPKLARKRILLPPQLPVGNTEAAMFVLPTTACILGPYLLYGTLGKLSPGY